MNLKLLQMKAKQQIIIKEWEHLEHGQVLLSDKELNDYHCTIIDNNNVIDCVVARQQMSSRFEIEHLGEPPYRLVYEPMHFACKRSLRPKGNFGSVMVTAEYIDGLIELEKTRINGFEKIYYVHLYEDCFVVFDVRILASKRERKLLDKHYATVTQPLTGKKERTCLYQIPFSSGVIHYYTLSKQERDEIYKGHKNPTSIEEIKELEKIPLGKVIPLAKVPKDNTKGISPLI
jgi:hypothetical protein